MFNRDSGLVKAWVSLINQGAFTVDDVPNLYNLREIVLEILEGENKNGI